MSRLLFRTWLTCFLLLVGLAIGLGMAGSTMKVRLTSIDPNVPVTVQIKSPNGFLSVPTPSRLIAEVVTPVEFIVKRSPYRRVELAVKGNAPNARLRIEANSLGQSASGSGHSFVLSQSGVTGLGVRTE